MDIRAASGGTGRRPRRLVQRCCTAAPASLLGSRRPPLSVSTYSRDAPLLVDYGRGRRESISRAARALADSPISASSAAACTVVRIRGAWGFAGGAVREAGAFGRAGALRRFGAAARGAGRAVALRRAGAGFAAASVGFAAGSAGVAAVSAGRARLALRRCGRVLGSDPSTSGGRSSSIAGHIIAQPARMRLCTRSETTCRVPRIPKAGVG